MLDIQIKIVDWLKNQLLNSNQKGFTVGISGGVDSALASTLCALTGQPTLAISLPIKQHQDQLKRCHNHISWLVEKYPNVSTKEFDLTSIQNTCQCQLIAIDENTNQEIVEVNMRSRLRMVMLYAFANTYKYLVVGTGNKVEDLALGFFSKYGDGGVDISPIGDLLKSEVRALAHYLGVHENIVNAVPTDGLWGDNRSDEDQLGATYDEIEHIMGYLGLVDEKRYQIIKTRCDTPPESFDPAKMLWPNLNDRQTDVLSLFLKRFNENKHKMSMPPICRLGDV